MKAYLDILRKVIEEGKPRGDRTGTGTLSIFSATFEHDMRNGQFPLVTTKKIFARGMFKELRAIIRGELHLESLLDEGVKIWDDWRIPEDVTKKRELQNYERIIWMQNFAPELLKEWEKLRIQCNPEANGHAWLDKHGVPRTADEIIARVGNLNAPYGPGWRAYQTANGPVDQFAYVMDLLRNNPESRRILVSAWNPGWMPEETRQVELSFDERKAVFKKVYPEAFARWKMMQDLDSITKHMDVAGVPTHKTVKVSPQENIINGKPCLTPCHWAFEFYVEDLTVNERLGWMTDHLPVERISLQIQLDNHEVYYEEHLHDRLTEFGVPRQYLSLKWHQRKHNCAF